VNNAHGGAAAANAAPNMGFILNGVRMKKSKYYYNTNYGYGYRYAYGYGYGYGARRQGPEAFKGEGTGTAS
jgi:hypothetical protein